MVRPLVLVLALGGFLGCMPALFSAAKHGDVEKLEKRKNGGDDLEACFMDRTALGYAASWKQLESVKKLLALGAKVDGVCPGGMGPALEAAAVAGSLPIVQLLVEHGASVNGVPEPGGSHLPLAGVVIVYSADDAADTKERLAIVRYLRGKGANPNLKGSGDRTPLEWAKAQGFTAAVTALEEPLPEPKAEPKPDAKP